MEVGKAMILLGTGPCVQTPSPSPSPAGLVGFSSMPFLGGELGPESPLSLSCGA